MKYSFMNWRITSSGSFSLIFTTSFKSSNFSSVYARISFLIIFASSFTTFKETHLASKIKFEKELSKINNIYSLRKINKPSSKLSNFSISSLSSSSLNLSTTSIESQPNSQNTHFLFEP